MEDANPRLKRILEKVRAKTFFEDLAEYGYLMQYVNQFMKKEFDTDEKFKLKVFKILYQYSKYPDNELAVYYLSHLNEVMKSFTSKVN
ncbi:hypothetical protein OAQ99_07115 [Candidatus Kapabacteria bacterium]|nr:hypothetical protein [Candidatus Kapabacteria bacterium]